jgi:hypothetical protein
MSRLVLINLGQEERLWTGQEGDACCRSCETTALPRSRRASTTKRGYAAVSLVGFPCTRPESFVFSTWERGSTQDRSRAHFGEGFLRLLGRKSLSGSSLALMYWNNGRLA